MKLLPQRRPRLRRCVREAVVRRIAGGEQDTDTVDTARHHDIGLSPTRHLRQNSNIGILNRQLNDPPRRPSIIKTVRGTGYVFSLPVEGE